ncbi:MAG: putative ABC transporter permease, partial [Lachnospiraceae bacterium]|nr:putative ABC transporter permease [Lachnospiraceae bacterium]
MFSKYNFDIITIIGIFMMLYVVGGISGWLYEMGFYRINFGYFVRRGHGIGPWLPIYGFGTLFILICTFLVREKPLYVFLVSAAVTGILELVTGWCLYHFFNGLRLWDYNTEI